MCLINGQSMLSAASTTMLLAISSAGMGRNSLFSILEARDKAAAEGALHAAVRLQVAKQP